MRFRKLISAENFISIKNLLGINKDGQLKIGENYKGENLIILAKVGEFHD